MAIHRRRHDERGFGLVEVTLVLAAFVLVAAALTPSVLRALQQARADAARAELRMLHEAMLGAAEPQTYGFVGDMGRLPYDLNELFESGTLPLFTATDPTGVGYGWNGPYVNRGVDAQDLVLDPWGMPYDVGVAGPGQVRSAGPNGLYDDADDIVYPPSTVFPFSTLIVSVKGHSGDLVDTDPEGCTVTLAYSAEGSYATVTDDAVPFSFENTHRGLHSVSATCARHDGGTASESAVVQVTGNEQQYVELHLQLGEIDSAADDATESAETDTEADGQMPAGNGQR